MFAPGPHLTKLRPCLLHAALEHLNKLSSLFQKRSFHFSHMQSALSLCQKKNRSIADSDQIINSLKLDWKKISNILPSSQNELFKDYFKLIGCTIKTYCETLLQNPEDRFPETKVQFAFCIFNAKKISLDSNQQQFYGNRDLKLLITKFNVVSAEQIL